MDHDRAKRFPKEPRELQFPIMLDVGYMLGQFGDLWSTWGHERSIWDHHNSSWIIFGALGRKGRYSSSVGEFSKSYNGFELPTAFDLEGPREGRER